MVPEADGVVIADGREGGAVGAEGDVVVVESTDDEIREDDLDLSRGTTIDARNAVLGDSVTLQGGPANVTWLGGTFRGPWDPDDVDGPWIALNPELSELPDPSDVRPFLFVDRRRRTRWLLVRNQSAIDQWHRLHDI